MIDDSGYVRAYRKVFENPVFKTDAEVMVFIWMVMKAAWKPCSVRYKGRVANLERGQLAVSIRDLADRMEWSKDRVSRFIKSLQQCDTIEHTSATGVNVITICNYDEYQAPADFRATEARQEQVAGRDTEQRKENTSPKGEGVPPVNIVKAIFDLGIALLTASGQTDRASRSIVGRWRKAYGDGRTMEALAACQAKSITNPVEWVPRFLGRSEQPQLSMTAQILARKRAACGDRHETN